MDVSNNFLLNKNGYIKKNIYATGWAANNSVGVIGTNKARSLEIVKKIISEIVPNKKNSTKMLIKKLKDANIKYISKNDWKVLDKLEEEKAMPNFVREKFKTKIDVFNALKEH